MAPAYCKPGARVSVAARDFNLPEDIKNGNNWAEQTFGPAWQHTRLPGTIISEIGHHQFLVKFDIDGETAPCKVKQLRRHNEPDDEPVAMDATAVDEGLPTASPEQLRAAALAVYLAKTDLCSMKTLKDRVAAALVAHGLEAKRPRIKEALMGFHLHGTETQLSGATSPGETPSAVAPMFSDATLDDSALMSSENERKIGACTVQGSYSLRVSKLPLKKNRPPPAPAGADKRAHHAMHAPVCHTPVVWFD